MDDELDDHAHERKQWLDARGRGPHGEHLLGASEAAAVLGWDRFTDAHQLWHRKAGLLPRQDRSEEADAGHVFEAAILRWYARRSGRRIVTPFEVAAQMLGDDMLDHDVHALAMQLDDDVEVHHRSAVGVTFRSKRHRWMTFSPDAFAHDAELGWGFVDAKNLAWHLEASWRDGIPAQYAPQIAHMTECVPSFQWGGFACCFGGQRLRWYDAKREDIEQIGFLVLELGEQFIDSLTEGVPPIPSERSAETLRRLYPTSSPSTVGWSGAVTVGEKRWTPTDFDLAWVEAIDQRRAWSKRCDELEAVIRHVAKDHEIVVLPDRTTYSLPTTAQGRRIYRKEPKR